MLTPGSVSKLAMRFCVLEKNAFAYFLIVVKQSTIVVAELTKDLPTELKKRVLAVGRVRPGLEVDAV